MKTYLYFTKINASIWPFSRPKIEGINLVGKVISHRDTKADGLYLDDFDDQDTLNYTYDQSGNLVTDLQASATITWTPYGKVASVDRDSLDQLITFGYGPDQNRFAKIKVNTTNLDATATYYIRDAQGNVMGVYKRVADSIFWQEQYLYGSSRLGVIEPGIAWDTNQLHVDSAYFLINPTFSVGCKGYEVADHLGNIRAVVSDRREAVDSTNNSEADFYEGVVLAANDYYPFGQRMPGRTFQSGSYRYGFNGKEKDEDEEWSDLTHYDYGFRIYNPAIGRFLSVDPLSPDYPWYTPYQFAGNRPIDGIDLDGLEYLDADLRFNYEHGPNPHLAVINSDGTYNLSLMGGSLMINNIEKVSIAGQYYYDIGQHVYSTEQGYSLTGQRSEQVTYNTKVGIQLINNLDNLPNAPANYNAPNWSTTDASEIALSQRQANQYDNCEGVCYATTESRAQQAYIDESGSGIVDLTVSGSNIDHRIAATFGTNDPFMGYGAGGSFARRGYGNTVDDAGVWAGNLQQGALLQRWNTTDQNNLFSNGGHSVIFRSYSYDSNGNINGINYTDYHGGESNWSRNDNENINTIMGVNLIDNN